MTFKTFIGLLLAGIPLLINAANLPLFKIEHTLGSAEFPSTIGWFSPPVTSFLTITNQTGASMPVTYTIPPPYQVDMTRSTCPATLTPGASCNIAVVFNPSRLGASSGKLQACGHGGLWCSQDPVGLNTTVIDNDIISTSCSTIQERPFAELDCAGAYTYAENFNAFISKVVGIPISTDHLQFNYFQHTPSTDETTIPCLQAKQTGANLDPLIEGGGVSLCNFMGYATGNSSPNPSTSKQYPPYLTLLLGTEYPIGPNTVPLAKKTELLTTFGQPAMNPTIQTLGYDGYIHFLTTYLSEQSGKNYNHCGNGQTCPSIYYLPYASNEGNLIHWPPLTEYHGMSGGGGSGGGYQIQAFRPGSNTHYTLFSGGGGGGGGNTTPEGLIGAINLLNTGSGGGGGSQFADCYVTSEGNLNGLGLGAGLGFGLSAREGSNINYTAPPSPDYSYYPPTLQSSWNNATILANYGSNLTELFHTLIPALYNSGYTIAFTGGGGGGTGLEFLNANGIEYQPQPVSIGYGFNFCTVLNKDGLYSPTDCISTSNVSDSRALFLERLIYKNIGPFFNEGMNLAIKACPGGYNDFQCTCTFQNAYVICKLSELLLINNFTSADIPTWLVTPHCSNTQATLINGGQQIDQLSPGNTPPHCATAIQNFFTAKKSTDCVPPWR